MSELAACWRAAGGDAKRLNCDASVSVVASRRLGLASRQRARGLICLLGGAAHEGASVSRMWCVMLCRRGLELPRLKWLDYTAIDMGEWQDERSHDGEKRTVVVDYDSQNLWYMDWNELGGWPLAGPRTASHLCADTSRAMVSHQERTGERQCPDTTTTSVFLIWRTWKRSYAVLNHLRCVREPTETELSVSAELQQDGLRHGRRGLGAQDLCGLACRRRGGRSTADDPGVPGEGGRRPPGRGRRSPPLSSDSAAEGGRRGPLAFAQTDAGRMTFP